MRDSTRYNKELPGPIHYVTNSLAPSHDWHDLKEEVEQYAERLGASVIFEDSIDKTIDAYTSLEDQRAMAREMGKS